MFAWGRCAWGPDRWGRGGRRGGTRIPHYMYSKFHFTPQVPLYSTNPSLLHKFLFTLNSYLSSKFHFSHFFPTLPPPHPHHHKSEKISMCAVQWDSIPSNLRKTSQPTSQLAGAHQGAIQPLTGLTISFGVCPRKDWRGGRPVRACFTRPNSLACTPLCQPHACFGPVACGWAVAAPRHALCGAHGTARLRRQYWTEIARL